MNRIEELTALLDQITPGKWETDWDDFTEQKAVTCKARRNKVPIAEIALGYCEEFDEEQEANARFIAVAPEAVRDMLEVVKAAQDLCDTTPRKRSLKVPGLRKALEALNDDH